MTLVFSIIPFLITIVQKIVISSPIYEKCFFPLFTKFSRLSTLDPPLAIAVSSTSLATGLSCVCNSLSFLIKAPN